MEASVRRQPFECGGHRRFYFFGGDQYEEPSSPFPARPVKQKRCSSPHSKADERRT